jgi:hypothetical protein
MASGNFFIGDELSLKGFRMYVQPILEGRGYSVPEVLSVGTSTILTSIVGEGDLEEVVNSVLVESGPIIEEAEKEIRNQSSEQYIPKVWSHNVSKFSHMDRKDGEDDVCVNKGLYKVVGMYEANETASKLFLLIAQEQLLIGVESGAERVTRQIRSLLGKKVSEV